MNTKWKVIISVMLLVISICAVLVFIILQQHDEKIVEFLNVKHNSTTLLADTILSNASRGYQKRIVAFSNPAASASRDAMIKAFANRDRKQLLEQSKKLFAVLQQESPYFSTIGWILPDNHVFLRVKFPEKFGDDISKIRPDVVAVNRDKRQRSGFNVGITSVQYRIVQPVFYHDKYIGALQFGINPDLMINALQSKLDTIAGMVILNNYCKHLSSEKQTLKCSVYTIHSAHAGLFKPVQNQLDWNQKKQLVLLNGRMNAILNVLEVSNFQNEQIGAFFVALDISKALAQKRTLLIKTLLMSSGLLIIAFLVLYFSYGSLVQTITDLNESLENKIKKRTEELAQQKAQLQATTENVPGVVFQFYVSNIGESGVYYVSPKLFDIFGLELIGDPSLFLQTFVDNIHEKDQQSWSDSVHSAVEKQIAWDWMGRYVKPSGEIIWFEGHSIPTVRKDEIVFDGILTDITEKREQEALKLASSLQKEQVKKLESLKTMAGAIAHRFNNAMMAVQGNLDIMIYTLPVDSKEYQLASNAAEAAKGASRVGSMMLSYVRQQPLVLQDVPLDKLVRESVDSLKSLLQSSISLQFVLPDRPLYCSVDQRQIKEVLISIITNAIESLSDGAGTIEITFGTESFTADSFPISFQKDLQDGMYTFCQIKDSGHGINPKDLSRIFEPFYTTRFVGRGLGLALTVGIMQSHHGALIVESEQGKGTAVRILLPSMLSSQQILSSDGVQRDTVQLSGHILLVDDEEMVLDVGKKMLELLGFVVHTASNGREAVEKIQSQKIDFCVAVLDISMPGMDGIEAMNVIRKINPTMPILLSSGYSEDDLSFTEIQENKLDGFLKKPFQLSDMRNSLEELLS